MEGLVKACETELEVATRAGTGRGGGQTRATVITLIFAGRRCRCRM